MSHKYTRPLNDHTELSLAVENVFDGASEDLLFYPRPGRWVSDTLGWRF